ncbi:MAG: TIGR03905 family TSCPD domain-containing protein [Muribaculaceae bacterium]|nr:TIGR03905 family TSCPD domain-containing protein [Muribaculaceae bacterium]
MKYQYKTQGTCSRLIDIEIEDGVIKNICFTGGCHGNLQGISKLVAGLKPEDVISRLDGVMCGSKGTSCPDQLSKALKAIIAQEQD